MALEGCADNRGISDFQLLRHINMVNASIGDHRHLWQGVFDQPQRVCRCLYTGGQTRNAQRVGTGVEHG